MNAALRFEVLTDLPAVAGVAAEWADLLERSPCDRTFGSPEWYLASIQTDPALAPYVVLARRGTALGGVLALARSPDGSEAGFPSQLADYNDLIALPGDAGAAAGLIDWARRGSRPLARLVLRRLRPDAACLAGASLLESRRRDGGGGEGGGGERRPSGWSCLYVDLPASFEDYLAGRSAKFRKMLRQAEARAAAGGLAVRRLTPEEVPAPRLVDLFLDLHRQRFGNHSLFAAPAPERFARAALPPLFARGRLIALAVLGADGAPLALDLCLHGGGSLGAWNGGFQPAAACWSPGRLLAAAGIRTALAMGCAEYDFLRGVESYKAHWTNGRRELLDLVVPVEA
jgi:CelD/BcsL family acetyltransferase involved in cellulose biosynthesis